MFKLLQGKIAAERALVSAAITDALEAVREAEAQGITVTEASPVDCGFDYVVLEFFVYGCKPGGNRRRLGAIQDRPGSMLWRIHGRQGTYSLAEIIRLMTNGIIEGSAL